MKKLFLSFSISSIVAGAILISCQKEPSFDGNKLSNDVAESRPNGTGKNYPPVANAGTDQTIILPTNTVLLDGSKSTDPNNNISSYLWTKISGPTSFTILNANAVQTQVSNLVEGVYLFELKVTDARGQMGKDTVQVQVLVNPDPSSPPPCTTNCGKIVFASARDGNDEIYTCNAEGSNIIRLTNDPAADGQPAWSPDGTRIAFIRSDIYVNIYGGDLYIMNADGSNVVRKSFSGFCMRPAWSPDGNKIAYNDGHTISIMDLTSGAVSQLPNTDGGDWLYPQPNWSPDGRKIAFHSDRNAINYFISDIFTISPDGSGFTLLTPIYSGDFNYFLPAWSPEGTKLSVSINNNTTGNAAGSIGVMNADGTGLRIIKSGLLLDFYLGTKTSWSSDGTRIVYTENNTIKWVAADGNAIGTIIANGWDADWQH